MGVQLADQRVILRPYTAADAPAMYEAARESVAEVGRWLPWCHADYALHDAEAWIALRDELWQRGEEYSLAVTERASGRYLGGCGINQIDRDRMRANLGYWIRTSACCRGYATSTARLLARFGIVELGLQRLEIVAAVGNLASQRVAAKAGAAREGVARCRIRIRDVPHDAVVFSFVRGDFEN